MVLFLHSLVGSAYEVVLEALVKLHKVGGEARDADNQVAVAFRVLLGLSQLVGAHDVVLNMHSVHIEVGLDKTAELCVTLVSGDGCGVEFHIEKRAV